MWFAYMVVTDSTSESQAFPEQLDWKACHGETEVGNGVQRYV